MVKLPLLAPQAVNFPCDRIRSLFPALQQEPGFIFFDNGAGAQIPQGVFNAINDHQPPAFVRFARVFEDDDHGAMEV